MGLALGSGLRRPRELRPARKQGAGGGSWQTLGAAWHL